VRTVWVPAIQQRLRDAGVGPSEPVPEAPPAGRPRGRDLDLRAVCVDNSTP